MRRSPLLSATILSLVLSCATQPAPAPTPAPAPVTEPAKAASSSEEVVGPPAVAWHDMTMEQRGKFMKKVVVPKMQPVFAAFDPDEFKELKCSTCHGHDPKSVAFKMPSPDLPQLPATREGFMELAQKKPKVMAFMKDQVLPQMAALIGEKLFDPSKPQEGGFGCMECHTQKQSP